MPFDTTAPPADAWRGLEFDDGTWPRLKVCRNCEWAFYDNSKNPGLKGTALGIAVNTAVFTFVNAVLIRGLPIADPDRTMAVDSFDRVLELRGGLDVLSRAEDQGKRD